MRIPPRMNLRLQVLLAPSVIKHDVCMRAQVLVGGLQDNASVEVLGVHAATLGTHPAHVKRSDNAEHLVYLREHRLHSVEQRNLHHTNGSAARTLLRGQRLRQCV